MKEKRLRKLLNGFVDAIAEPVRPGLAEDIKCQIAHRLMLHRGGMDTVNIRIDLRTSK